MSSSKKKKTAWLRTVLIIIAAVGISFLAGLGIGTLLENVVDELPLDKILLELSVVFIFIWIFSFLHTVLHEAGHLIFGLLTGYKFYSFRVGSFMWVKLDGKLKLKRFALAGTGGQCLMGPPDLVNGTMPYVWYNLGGGMVNIIFSLIPLVIALLSGKTDYVLGIVILWAFLGISTGLMNIIPMKIQGFPNDGYNIMSLGKDPEALRAFWLQMKVGEQQATGKCLKEMPKEWFVLPSEEGMQNSMIASVAVFCCNRLMDEGNYKEADELMERLLTEKNGIVGIYRNCLKADQMYCELVGENRKERYEKLYTKEVQQFFAAMKKSPNIYRILYLYEKYVEKNEKKAEQAMKNFEKVSATYPYPHEIKGEREMIAFAEEKLAEE